MAAWPRHQKRSRRRGFARHPRPTKSCAARTRGEPCLATLAAKVPAGPQWAFEIKWDGYRLHVHVEPTGVRIITRGGHDWTHRFPAIASAAGGLGAGTAIIDGEAVVLDELGRSSFPKLQQVLGGRGGKRVAPEAMFYAFDVLYLDGVDLRPRSLDERRGELAGLLAAADPAGWLRLSEEVDGDGGALLRHACAMGLEGIIAKDQATPVRIDHDLALAPLTFFPAS